ncbi:MAG: response regulator [Pseudomonas fluorescens]|nr:response regulator [Pseudomonas fluorescens]
MINKALRIMIADPEHAQRLRLERDLNRQGYYAIAPVPSLSDLLNLVEYGDRGFDLVLMNASLAGTEGFNLHDFCGDHSSVGQVFIYDLPPRQLTIQSAKIDDRLVFSAVQLPEAASIRRLAHKADLSRLSVIS